MDVATSLSNINWLSVIVAAVSCFVIGGIWYGPVFGRAWMTAIGFTEERLKERSVPKTFGVSLILAFIASLVLDMFIGHEADVVFGAMAGFFAGFGWVATFMGIMYVFEMRSLRLFLINAGYCVVSLTTMGAILGSW
ncbi:MAG: DUF1761 domain-containing protein [Bacteroidia bacterium]|nr:DUF1761 domain-containing protein [Bacteroidia bacterium]